MATDSITSLLNTANSNSLTRTGDLNYTQAASGLVDPTGTVGMFLSSTGRLVGADGNGIASAVSTLTDAATVTWAWSKSANFAQVTLGGNRTLSITGMKTGDRGILKVIQDATGSRTLTYPTTTLKPGTPLTTTASAADLLEFVCVDASGPTFWMISDTKNVS